MVSGCHSDKDNPLHGKDTDERIVMCLENAYPEHNFKVVKSFDKQKNEGLFEDENGKMNLGLEDIKGELLVISQFTLYGDCIKGRRPGFVEAARPEIAKPLYEKFLDKCRSYGIKTEAGIFGADMKVELLNDGPVTLIIDTKDVASFK